MKALRTSLLVMVIAITGQLSAQPTPPPVPAAPTGEEMTKTTALLSKQVPADLNHIQSLQSLARKQNDEIKLNCVNDQSLKAKAAANRFDKHMGDWKIAVDPNAQQTAFQGVTLEGGNVRQARDTAERCVGKNELVGENATTRPQIPNNPTEGGTDVGATGSGNGGGVEPPAIASPYN